MNYQIISVLDHPHMKTFMAQWFSDKWGIPESVYMESMEACLEKKTSYPQWYIAMDGDRIIGGLGVIENDFHDRKDLSPNVCAVYTEPEYRSLGIAGALLNFACADMASLGIRTLYLVTDHTSFYERYGWEFFCTVHSNGEKEPSRLYVHRISE